MNSKACLLLAVLATTAILSAACASNEETIPEPGTPEKTTTTVDRDAGEASDRPASTSTTGTAEDPDFRPGEDPVPEPDSYTEEEVEEFVVETFTEAATDDTPSFEDCQRLSNGDMGDLSVAEAAACMDALMAVLDECALWGCEGIGTAAEQADTAEPFEIVIEEPEPAIDPPATTTEPPEPAEGTPLIDPEQTTTTTTTVAATTTTLPIPEGPRAGDIPVVHLDTPTPPWELGTVSPHDGCPNAGQMPRMVEPIQAWLDWYGDYRYTRYLLCNMAWALDYLDADTWCVVDQYYERFDDLDGADFDLNNVPPLWLTEAHGWHQCPTVIDPLGEYSRGSYYTLLSDTGMSLADRCRTVLPEDIQLERDWFYDIEDDSEAFILDNDPDAPERFASGHAGCDEWAEYVQTFKVDYPSCHESSKLAEEWMEHYRGVPENYPAITC